MKMWLIEDKIDPRRTAIVGPGTQAEAVKRFEAERLSVSEIKGIAIVNAIREGVEFLELGKGAENGSV